jgi:hypothetical protein
MDHARKKDLLREYREIKPQAGIFAVTCTAAGKIWTSASPNLATAKNGVWFQLRAGGYINKQAQAAWNEHGESAFAFEVLEEIADDNREMVALLLKEREAHWRKERGAEKLVG